MEMLKIFQEHIDTLYKYRELIANLVGKDLKARYRGSAMGMMWTFLNPLLLLLVYALVFSVYMRVQVQNYAVFVFSGLLPWIWFSSSLLDWVNSITASGALITKSMFPAEILPMVKVIANMVNYLFSLPLLLIFMVVYGVPITLSVMWLPLIAFAQLLFTIGLVYVFSALNVRFRDVQHILNNFLVLWFFLCPIIYPISQTPEKWRFTFYLNPMATLSIAYQDIFVSGKTPNLVMLLALLVVGLAITLFGFSQFDRYKESFAEEI